MRQAASEREIFLTGLFYLLCGVLGSVLAEMSLHYMRGHNFWDWRGALCEPGPVSGGHAR